MDITKITHIPYKVLKAKPSGLLPTPKDERDFGTSIFNWFGYTPQHIRHIIETLSIRNQGSLNTCQWNATTVQKEPDEEMKLNTRLLVCKGNKLGLVSGDGFSNLRSGQKVLHDWGIPAKDVLPEIANAWKDYISPNPDLYQDRASQHKIGSYWSVSSRNDVLKLLDDNRIVVTGIMWWTGFNQGGGFKDPWIIYQHVGYKVGGHAFVIIGYDMNYHGRKVWICQNSYGSSWGDGGKFYIDMDYMDDENYGYFTNIDDIDKDVGKLITEYDGQNVKGAGDPGIFHIQKGQKKAYPDWESYLAWNGKRRGFHEVDLDVLKRVPDGDIMDIKKSDYWDFLKDVKESNRLEALLEKLNKEN